MAQKKLASVGLARAHQPPIHHLIHKPAVVVVFAVCALWCLHEIQICDLAVPPWGPMGHGHEHGFVLIGLCWPDGRSEALSKPAKHSQSRATAHIWLSIPTALQVSEWLSKAFVG